MYDVVQFWAKNIHRRVKISILYMQKYSHFPSQ